MAGRPGSAHGPPCHSAWNVDTPGSAHVGLTFLFASLLSLPLWESRQLSPARHHALPLQTMPPVAACSSIRTCQAPFWITLVQGREAKSSCRMPLVRSQTLTLQYTLTPVTVLRVTAGERPQLGMALGPPTSARGHASAKCRRAGVVEGGMGWGRRVAAVTRRLGSSRLAAGLKGQDRTGLGQAGLASRCTSMEA